MARDFHLWSWNVDYTTFRLKSCHMLGHQNRKKKLTKYETRKPNKLKWKKNRSDSIRIETFDQNIRKGNIRSQQIDPKTEQRPTHSNSESPSFFLQLHIFSSFLNSKFIKCNWRSGSLSLSSKTKRKYVVKKKEWILKLRSWNGTSSKASFLPSKIKEINSSRCTW